MVAASETLTCGVDGTRGTTTAGAGVVALGVARVGRDVSIPGTARTTAGVAEVAGQAAPGCTASLPSGRAQPQQAAHAAGRSTAWSAQQQQQPQQAARSASRATPGSAQ